MSSTGTVKIVKFSGQPAPSSGQNNKKNIKNYLVQDVSSQLK